MTTIPKLKAAEKRFPDPPEHLSEESAAIWKSVLADYDLAVTELSVLKLALEALDRCEMARQEIEQHGAFMPDRYGGRRTSPAVGVERDARLAAGRLLKQLGLEPPTMRGGRWHA